MQVIPAIDLKGGECVRLRQGQMEKAISFSSHPAKMARHWLSKGARRLHLVDLDGALAAQLMNLVAIKAIIKEINGQIPIQLGGGIRHLDTINELFRIGINRVILGTAAVKNQNLVKEACQHFPGRIWVGIDAKNGLVAIEGWAQISQLRVVDLANTLADIGVAGIIYTDIERDGMLSGINLTTTIALAQQVSIPVIASGGVKNLNDIRALLKLGKNKIPAVIVGRCLYEGIFDLVKAQQLCDCYESK